MCDWGPQLRPVIDPMRACSLAVRLHHAVAAPPFLHHLLSALINMHSTWQQHIIQTVHYRTSQQTFPSGRMHLLDATQLEKAKQHHTKHRLETNRQLAGGGSPARMLQEKACYC